MFENQHRKSVCDCQFSLHHIHCVSKQTSHLWIWHTRSDCDNFWQKCYWESKKSDDALFSQLTSPVLQHYLAKEETQKTAHWCFAHATQSNCCSALNFLSLEPCPQQPQAKCIDYKIQGVTQQLSMSCESKKLKKTSSNWLNSDNALIQRVKNAIFVLPVLPRNAQAQVIWGGLVSVLWLLTLSVAFLPKKISKSVHVRESYSKAKVGRFFETQCITN